jgi:GNAT superfamily N-acetyltransferase
LTSPGGAYLVGWRGGAPIAGGGLRRLDEHTSEIKRMYVAPEARSQGVARRLLGALEAAARARGYARIRLDTGNRQPHALALYRSAGYVEIENYNGATAPTFWGEKILG